jgi:hypothetical protein
VLRPPVGNRSNTISSAGVSSASFCIPH